MPKYTVTFTADEEEGETTQDVIDLAEKVLMDEGFGNVQCVQVVG